MLSYFFIFYLYNIRIQSSQPTQMNYDSKVRTYENRNYSPYAKAKIYGDLIRSTNPQPQYSTYRNQNYRTTTGTQQFSGSRIGQLNDRLTQQTEMIRMRNELKRKNLQVRSSSSQLRRSQLSADRKRRPAEYIEYGRGSNYHPLRYQSQTQSLTSSRASQQILSRPIISHGRQPLPFAMESVNFRKQKPGEFTQQTISRKPILQVNRSPGYHVKSAQSQAVPYFKTASPIESQTKVGKAIKNQQFDQFLDMDFHHNQPEPMESFRSGPMEREQEPVSPVTYNNANTVMRHTSEKVQPQSLDPPNKFSNRSSEKLKSSLTKRVTELIQKVDYDGKIITIILVGIGIILVLFQLIR